jgi:hypothetical protein
MWRISRLCGCGRFWGTPPPEQYPKPAEDHQLHHVYLIGLDIRSWPMLKNSLVETVKAH